MVRSLEVEWARRSCDYMEVLCWRVASSKPSTSWFLCACIFIKQSIHRSCFSTGQKASSFFWCYEHNYYYYENRDESELTRGSIL